MDRPFYANQTNLEGFTFLVSWSDFDAKRRSHTPTPRSYRSQRTPSSSIWYSLQLDLHQILWFCGTHPSFLRMLRPIIFQPLAFRLLLSLSRQVTSLTAVITPPSQDRGASWGLEIHTYHLHLYLPKKTSQ